MQRTAALLTSTLFFAALGHAQTAQSPAAPAGTPAKPQPFSGCVTQSATDKTVLVYSTPTVCAKLTGPLATPSLAGHQVDLSGMLTRGSGKTIPAIIQIDGITHTGDACTATCALLPPGKRGLGGERPGKEGGTPGLVPSRPQTPEDQ